MSVLEPITIRRGKNERITGVSVGGVELKNVQAVEIAYPIMDVPYVKVTFVAIDIRYEKDDA